MNEMITAARHDVPGSLIYNDTRTFITLTNSDGHQVRVQVVRGNIQVKLSPLANVTLTTPEEVIGVVDLLNEALTIAKGLANEQEK